MGVLECCVCYWVFLFGNYCRVVCWGAWVKVLVDFIFVVENIRRGICFGGFGFGCFGIRFFYFCFFRVSFFGFGGYYVESFIYGYEVRIALFFVFFGGMM